MIARVIVDVPSAQTNRLFDYLVPKEWEPFLQVGMRVIVPFGPRTVQGFIMEITSNSELNKLKPILELQDHEPILTEELIDVGKWVAEQTLCYQISAFQVMLPAALKTKVKKEWTLKSQLQSLPIFIQTLFLDTSVLTIDHLKGLTKQEKVEFQTLILEGKIEESYQLKNRANKKMKKWISLNPSSDSVEEMNNQIPKGAKKQQLLLTALMERQAPISKEEILTKLKFGRQTLNALLDKKLLIEVEEEVYREAMKGLTIQQSKPLKLTEMQENSLLPILEAIEQTKHETFLLHGVTGSGKTEIYLQAIAEVIEKGKQAIMLVPEISLTPQMVQRFKGRFGEWVAVLHSGLSVGEKYDEWRKIERQEVKVVVGARSAIFAPFNNIGVIIIDEEHETSYKQEDHPKYHAREVAKYRAQTYQCPVILGSATPSLESYARAKKGVYTLLKLNERVKNQPLPKVEMIDMREELRNGNRSMFSQVLMEEMKIRLQKKEQMVLFLNRRGHSTFVMCRDCGHVEMCEHCDVSLTYHRNQNRLKCHYCGNEHIMPNTCSSCGSEHIRFFGSGTQKVEEELTKVLPEAKVIRMDVDTTSKKGSHQKLLEAFERKEADILLGTQMIAKGLDFPAITLVGVLSADSMLHLPDFRSAERTFQLLEQVSGRAGRHELPGQVVIQSYNPEHYSNELVQTHDYEKFFEIEMGQRKQVGYPPYYFMVLINISHTELTQVISTSEKIVEILKRELSSTTIILGPVVSPLAKIKDRYRYQCLIKYKNEPKLMNVLHTIQEHFMNKSNSGHLQVQIDLNPYTFM
ncbi:primosome assembly protein PriA [Bacillus sp. TS-2]|nr:primosome assembly protein PriA [Bacillus sp. TS-2]